MSDDPTQELVVWSCPHGYEVTDLGDLSLCARCWHGYSDFEDLVATLFVPLATHQALEARLEGLQKAAQEAVRALRYRAAELEKGERDG